MGSSRLPNKMLLHLHGQPVVSWVFIRMQRCKTLDRLVFAIPEGKRDNVLQIFLESMGAEVFRGPEEDVLHRYIKVAKMTSADNVVRICADNPLISWEAVDLLIQEHLSSKADYTYNHIPISNSWPDGLGAEICTQKTLQHLHEVSRKSEDREHVFNYLTKNPDLFNIHTFDPPKQSWKQPELKLDLDTLNDYEKLMKHPIFPEMTVDEIIRAFRDKL